MKGRFGALFHLVPFQAHDAVRDVRARLTRQDGNLEIAYTLHGDISRLRIPRKKTGGELWQHTCFEIFLAPRGMPSYFEFNFSPSGEWAAYAFAAYRQGARFTPSAAPVMAAKLTQDVVELTATIDVEPLGAHAVGLSAVVESIDGSLHYWALKHPAAKPDFHHPDAFAARLE